MVKRLLGLAYFWVGSANGVQFQLWATWLLYAVLVDLTDAVAEELKGQAGMRAFERPHAGQLVRANDAFALHGQRGRVLIEGA